MKSKRGNSSEEAEIRVIAERSRRVYAFGDIHGCHRELELMLDTLTAKHGANSEDLFVFIGDYIDRGPNSKGVIDTLLQWSRAHPKTVFVRGNHEDMLLDFLGMGGNGGEVYLGNGGSEFFKSYGIDPHGPLTEVAKSLPTEHLRFLTSLELGVCVGEFLFVHAGIDPTVALEGQRSQDLMWIRSEFIPREHNLGKTVVFGHTPFADVFVHMPYKIGIDTGLVYGNIFSVAELVEGNVFQLELGGDEVTVSTLTDRLNSGSD